MRLLRRFARWAGLVVVMATGLPVLAFCVGANYLAVRAAEDMAVGIALGAVTLAVWCLYEEEHTEEDLFERHGYMPLGSLDGQEGAGSVVRSSGVER